MNQPLNKTLGYVIGSVILAPQLGYQLGAWKLMAILIGVPLMVAGSLKLAGYEAPSQPKPRECIRYETQTKDVVLSDLSSARMTAQFCVEWEKR